MKKEMMYSNFNLDGIEWAESKELAEGDYLLNFLILEEIYNYGDGTEYITKGVLVSKEELVKVVAMFNCYAEWMRAPVVVYCSKAVTVSNREAFIKFDVLRTVMHGRGKPLAYLNLRVVPEEYRTESWRERLRLNPLIQSEW